MATPKWDETTPTWEDTQEAAPAWDETTPSWDETQETSSSEPGMFEAFGHNLTNFFGFQDEIEGGFEAAGRALGVQGLGGPVDEIKLAEGGPTLDRDTLSKAYTERRDARRAYMDELREAQPSASFAGQLTGDIATGVAGGAVAGGLAKGTGLASRAASGLSNLSMAKKAGLGGAAFGLGESKEDDVAGLALDTAVGGVTGLAVGKGMDLVGKGLNKIPEAGKTVRKGFSKIGSWLSGVDEEALLRQANRAKDVAAAEGDEFIYDLAQKAQGEVLSNKSYFGQKVGEAGDDFLKQLGKKNFKNDGQLIAKDIDNFLKRNKPSSSGFSALTEKQADELAQLSEKLKGKVTGEDLFKFREYVDSVKNVAKKYDVDETGPFVNFLKQLRHKADEAVDVASPKLDSANKAFSNFIEDSKLLNINKDNVAESVIGNLYGLNKTAKQKAAERILSPSTFESVKDIAANKAVEAAKRPGLGGYTRAAGMVLTGGASIPLTSPTAWKHTMRALRPENFSKLGKFAQPISAAFQRGGNSLGATHYLLFNNNPEYRELIHGLEGEADE